MTLQMVRLRTVGAPAAEAGSSRTKVMAAVTAVSLSPRPFSSGRAYGS